MQVISPDAPIKASAPVPLKNAPEHRPIADSSRFTGTCRKRSSRSTPSIKSAIQVSGRLVTSVMRHFASSSRMRAVTPGAEGGKGSILPGGIILGEPGPAYIWLAAGLSSRELALARPRLGRIEQCLQRFGAIGVGLDDD